MKISSTDVKTKFDKPWLKNLPTLVHSIQSENYDFRVSDSYYMDDEHVVPLTLKNIEPKSVGKNKRKPEILGVKMPRNKIGKGRLQSASTLTDEEIIKLCNINNCFVSAPSSEFNMVFEIAQNSMAFLKNASDEQPPESTLSNERPQSLQTSKITGCIDSEEPTPSQFDVRKRDKLLSSSARPINDDGAKGDHMCRKPRKHLSTIDSLCSPTKSNRQKSSNNVAKQFSDSHRPSTFDTFEAIIPDTFDELETTGMSRQINLSSPKSHEHSMFGMAGGSSSKVTASPKKKESSSATIKQVKSGLTNEFSLLFSRKERYVEPVSIGFGFNKPSKPNLADAKFKETVRTISDNSEPNGVNAIAEQSNNKISSAQKRLTKRRKSTRLFGTRRRKSRKNVDNEGRPKTAAPDDEQHADISSMSRSAMLSDHAGKWSLSNPSDTDVNYSEEWSLDSGSTSPLVNDNSSCESCSSIPPCDMKPEPTNYRNIGEDGSEIIFISSCPKPSGKHHNHSMMSEKLENKFQESSKGIPLKSNGPAGYGAKRGTQYNRLTSNSVEGDDEVQIIDEFIRPKDEHRFVNRRISHLWSEADGSIQSYEGTIVSVNNKGMCSINYDGHTDAFLLTISELFEDFRNRDLTFI